MPNIGAVLPDKEDQGVLPSNGAPSMSASSDENNGVVTGFMADGGAPEDIGQDTGNAMPPEMDPFNVVTNALNYGRKKYGLPLKFFGSNEPAKSPQGEAVERAVADEGGTAPPTDEMRAFNLNNAIGQMGPDEGVQWGDTFVPGQNKGGMYLAEGGVIPEEGEEPMGEQPAGGGMDQQAAMAYLSGQDGISPDQVAALEQAVDPQGTMDPNSRRLQAIQRAGSPEAAFGLMQHYRQRFNAYSAFARAAIQGSGGRPPNGMSAADALNKAYQNIPDGTDLRFTPVRGGMKVAMRKVIPSKPAPSGGEQPPPQQNFAEGGEVDVDYETAGARPWAGTQYDIERQAEAAADDSVDDSGEDWATRQQNRKAKLQAIGDKVAGALAPTEGEVETAKQIGGAIASGASAVASGAKALWDKQDWRSLQRPVEFVMSIPQLLKWLTNSGQFDSVAERGVEETLKGDGAQPFGQGGPQYPRGMEPGAQGTHDVGNTIRGRNAPPMPQDKPQQFSDQPTAFAANWPTPELQKVVQQAAQEPTLKDVLHEIDLAFPYVGQSQQKALARAQAIQEWNKNQVTIKREGMRNEALAGRSAATNASRENVAHITTEGRLAGIERQAQAAAERQLNSLYSRQQIEGMKQQGQWDRMVQQEKQKYMRTLAITDPRSATNPDRMNKNMQGYQGVQPQAPNAPQPGPAPGGAQMETPQLPPAALSALKEGQVTTFKNGQKWTLQGGKPVQVQ